MTVLETIRIIDKREREALKKLREQSEHD